MNRAAQELAKRRWAKVPAEDRQEHARMMGKARRKYPQCKLFRAHRWRRDGTCQCGYAK